MSQPGRSVTAAFGKILLVSAVVLAATLAVSWIPAVHDGRYVPVFTFALLQGTLVLLSGAGALVGLVGYAVSAAAGRVRSRAPGE